MDFKTSNEEVGRIHCNITDTLSRTHARARPPAVRLRKSLD